MRCLPVVYPSWLNSSYASSQVYVVDLGNRISAVTKVDPMKLQQYD